VNKLIRYVLFLPASFLVSFVGLKVVQFIAAKLVYLFTTFGLLQNGLLGKIFFGDYPIAIFIIGFLIYFIFGYIFVLCGSLIAPDPKKYKSIFLFLLVVLLGTYVFFVDGTTVAAVVIQYIGIIAGGLKAMIGFLAIDADVALNEG